MKNFVISLTSATERRHHIEQQFQSKQIPFEFFDAISHSEVEKTSIQLGLHGVDHNMSQGEMACLLSHVSLWQLAVTERLPHIAIFEDDVYLGQTAAKFLLNDAWIPQACDIIKLEKFVDQILGHIKPEFQLPQQRKLFALRHKHVGAAGYVLSLEGARQMLAFVRQQIPLRPADHVLFDDFLDTKQLPVFQMLPAICIQEYVLQGSANTANRLPSSLEQERFDTKQQYHQEPPPKQKQSLVYKAWREIKRPVRQFFLLPQTIYNKLATHKVTFE